MSQSAIGTFLTESIFKETPELKELCNVKVCQDSMQGHFVGVGKSFNEMFTGKQHRLNMCMQNGGYPKGPHGPFDNYTWHYNCYYWSKCVQNEQILEWEKWLLKEYNENSHYFPEACTPMFDCLKNTTMRDIAYNRCLKSDAEGEAHCNVTGECQNERGTPVTDTKVPPYVPAPPPPKQSDALDVLLYFSISLVVGLLLAGIILTLLVKFRQKRYRDRYDVDLGKLDGAGFGGFGTLLMKIVTRPPVLWFGPPSPPMDDTPGDGMNASSCDASNKSGSSKQIVEVHAAATKETSSDAVAAACAKPGTCVLCGGDTRNKKDGKRYILLPCRCEWCGCEAIGEDKKGININTDILRQLTPGGRAGEEEAFRGYPTQVDLLKYTLAVEPAIVPLPASEGRGLINTCACKRCNEPLQAIVNVHELYLDVPLDMTTEMGMEIIHHHHSDSSFGSTTPSPSSSSQPSTDPTTTTTTDPTILATNTNNQSSSASTAAIENDDEDASAASPLLLKQNAGGPAAQPNISPSQVPTMISNMKPNNTDDDGADDGEMTDKKEKKQSSREIPNCSVCKSVPACVALLNCGHLVTCVNCAAGLRKPVMKMTPDNRAVEISPACVMCQKAIDAMVVLNKEEVEAALAVHLQRNKWTNDSFDFSRKELAEQLAAYKSVGGDDCDEEFAPVSRGNLQKVTSTDSIGTR